MLLPGHRDRWCALGVLLLPVGLGSGFVSAGARCEQACQLLQGLQDPICAVGLTVSCQQSARSRQTLAEAHGCQQMFRRKVAESLRSVCVLNSCLYAKLLQHGQQGRQRTGKHRTGNAQPGQPVGRQLVRPDKESEAQPTQAAGQAGQGLPVTALCCHI